MPRVSFIKFIEKHPGMNFHRQQEQNHLEIIFIHSLNLNIMKKQIISLLVLIFACTQVFAQVAINADGSLPDNSAILDVKSTTQGLLIPKMGQSQRDAIVNPAQGLLIFQRPTSTGFYYNAGTPAAPTWYKINASDPTAPVSQFWDITGNSGTDPSINFIGTQDNVPLVFKVNNQLAGKIENGSHNTSFGYQSNYLNSAGTDNVASGYQALYSNKSGIKNCATGSQALFSITSGMGNVANGYQALYSDTSGSRNIAHGYLTLYSNTSGWDNTANGAQAMYSNTTGHQNTADGKDALVLNTTGYQNVANGSEALYDNYTGSQNVASGFRALFYNQSGTNNTATGMNSLYWNSGGNFNTAEGRDALSLNYTGSYNTAVGYNSGTSGSFNNTISIGNNGWPNAFHNQAFIGNQSTIYIGGWVGWSTFTDSRIKDNVREDVKGLDFITRLRPVTYHQNLKAIAEFTGNKDSTDYPEKNEVEKIKYSGFLAQEVAQAASESGYEFSGINAPRNSRELYSLSYEQFVVPLVKAVQELNATNAELKQEISQLTLRIEKLENK